MTTPFALYYLLAFIGFTGYGVLFLNAESILALCFFIFFGLIVQKSDAISATLDEQKLSIKTQLVNLMIHGQKQHIIIQKLIIFKKAQLLNGCAYVLKAV